MIFVISLSLCCYWLSFCLVGAVIAVILTGDSEVLSIFGSYNWHFTNFRWVGAFFKPKDACHSTRKLCLDVAPAGLFVLFEPSTFCLLDKFNIIDALKLAQDLLQLVPLFSMMLVFSHSLLFWRFLPLNWWYGELVCLSYYDNAKNGHLEVMKAEVLVPFIRSFPT